MVAERRRFDSKYLVIILSVIVVLIIILVLANISLLLSKKNDGGLAKDCLSENIDVSVGACLDDLAYSYYDDGDCERALKVYEDIPEDRFDKYELQDYYDDAYSLSLECDDTSLQDYWENKSNALSNQSEGRS